MALYTTILAMMVIFAIAIVVCFIRDHFAKKSYDERLKEDIETAFMIDPYFAEHFSEHTENLDTFLNNHNIPKQTEYES